MRRWRAPLVCAWLALAWPALAPAPARAQSAMRIEVSSRRIEVDEPLTVQVTLDSPDGSSPTRARLAVPPGVRLSGPSVSQRTQVTLSNGRMQQQLSVSLSWTLRASKPGTYRIGPPSVEIAGRSESGQAFSIEVVPQGAGTPRPTRPDPFSQFGLFPGFPGFPRGFPFDTDEQESEPALPPVPPEYQVERAPDPVAFLVAKASPRKVVLGQAINFKIIAYAGNGAFQGVNPTDPSRDGFLTFDVENEAREVAVPIGGKIFTAQKAREFVLFPIRTGTLRIGPMRLGFAGRGYPATPGSLGAMRQSEAIDIQVVEPPLAGRPPGYRIGDVGDYRLKASVEPKSVREGEAVSVIATLEGTGNIPAKLNLPQQNGVDWLEPTLLEKLDADSSGVHGYRTFTYVVKLEHAGSIDLGELTLPYYNADKGSYAVARAVLGKVEVRADPTQKAQSTAAPPQDRLKGLVKPPQRLGEPAKGRHYTTDSPAFFAWLGAGPMLVLASSGLLRLSRRMREHLRERDATPSRKALRELQVASQLASTGADLVSVSAALDRALHFAIEARTGIKGRGVLRSELAGVLSAQGVNEALTRDAVSVLESIENVRFVPGDADSARDLLARAESTLRELLRSARA